jgi:MFS family permease
VHWYWVGRKIIRRCIAVIVLFFNCQSHFLDKNIPVPFIQLLGGMFGPMVRSLVSKIIPNEEVGKILALVSAAQFFFGMAGSPIYSAIYNKTISTHSEIFNFVTAGFYVFEILITICIIYVRTVYVTTSVTYTRIINEESENCGTVTTDEMVA